MTSNSNYLIDKRK